MGAGDAATGTITSPPFALERNFVHFLIGGGDHPLGVEPATSVQLLVDGHDDGLTTLVQGVRSAVEQLG